MESGLFVPVVSIHATKRRRFAWAVWWTGAPVREPFRRPDAHGGGAVSPDAAQRDAEALAGMRLRVIESSWARAWSKILVGQDPWPSRRAADDRDAIKPGVVANATSVWAVLGVTPQATPEELKQAFRRRSLQTHPDHGGDAAAFRAVVAAYAEARKRIARPRRAAR